MIQNHILILKQPLKHGILLLSISANEDVVILMRYCSLVACYALNACIELQPSKMTFDVFGNKINLPKMLI